MANEKYGLEILKVREIMGMMDVTSVPTTPAFVRGVITCAARSSCGRSATLSSG